MKRSAAYLLVSLAVLVLLQACAGRNRARVIPKDTMSHIYAEMFIADQWVKDHPASRKKADTTFFYDPIFKKYGYDTRDYDASVKHYAESPDVYAKILESAATILEAETAKFNALKVMQDRMRESGIDYKGHVKRQFSSDTIWRHSLVGTDIITIRENVERRYSVRPDSLEALGLLPWAESAADKGEDL